jgi:hypothetical protein
MWEAKTMRGSFTAAVARDESRYLWYSAQQEAACHSSESKSYQLNDPGDRGFSIYLGPGGFPVRVTDVTAQPRSFGNFSDITALGRVQKPLCLVSASGALQEEGRRFCREKNLPERAASVLALCAKPAATPRELQLSL